MRGATAAGSALPGPPCNFNPRAPCGARLVLVGTAYLAWSFQSTRPMRGATEHPESQRQFQPFQSTRPMRGATYSWPEWRALRLISIHAPHAGRDLTAPASHCIAGGISIHAPHAGRDPPGIIQCWPSQSKFQSTRPMRGATRSSLTIELYRTVFQSTRPMRGATESDRARSVMRVISIHAPHAGRDTAPPLPWC